MQISPDILAYAHMYYKNFFFFFFFFFFLLYFLLSTTNNRNLKLPFFDDVKIAANGNYKLEKITFISNTLNAYTIHRIILILHFMLMFLCPEESSRGILKSQRPSVGPPSRYKSCLMDNLKTAEANLMKLHRKIKRNEKVCRAQQLSS